MKSDDETRMVRDLGDSIGYGRMMQLAEQLWRERLKTDGGAGGEFTIGPCAALMEPCQCVSGGKPGPCGWCCGAGRVTREVRGMQRRVSAISALLKDAKAHRQLTPTELDIERLVAGELAGPELEQLLRRGR